MRPVITRSAPHRVAVVAAVLLVAACGGAAGSSPSGAAAPTTAVRSAAPPSASPVQASSPEAVGPPQPGEPWIAFQWGDTDGSGTVWLVKPDGTRAHVLTMDMEGTELHPTWSPDGSTIVFTRELPNGRKPIWAINPDGSGAHELAACELPCNMFDGPQWLASDPGGIWLQHDADVTPAGPPSKLMISRLDLATKRVEPRYTTHERSVDSPRVSPNAKLAVYEGHRDIFGGPAGSALFVVDLATGAETQITDWALNATQPDWLDDTTIVFNTCGVSSEDCPTEPMNLYRVGADGSGLTQLTTFTAVKTGVAQARVTPDRTSILVVIVDDAGGVLRHLGRINPDGTGLESISTTIVPGTHPDLRPTP